MYQFFIIKCRFTQIGGYMNNDDHLEALKKHYIEEIHEALYESKVNQGESINYELLNDKILLNWKSAHMEGVSFELFTDWVIDALPDHKPYLEITKIKKSA